MPYNWNQLSQESKQRHEEARRKRRERRNEEQEENEREDAKRRQREARIRRGRSAITIHIGLIRPDESNINLKEFQHDVGEMSYECDRCHALCFKEEINRTTLCCINGKVKLPEFEPIPAFLLGLFKGKSYLEENDLWSGLTDKQKSIFIIYKNVHIHFKQYCRSYNNSMALASFTYNQEHLNGHGPPVIKIKGTIYRRFAKDLPVSNSRSRQNDNIENQPPIPLQPWVNNGTDNNNFTNIDSHYSYAHLYFFTADQAADSRLQRRTAAGDSINGGLYREILVELHSMFIRTNPHARTYFHLSEVLLKTPNEEYCIVIGDHNSNNENSINMAVPNYNQQNHRIHHPGVYHKPSGIGEQDLMGLVLRSEENQSAFNSQRLLVAQSRNDENMQNLIYLKSYSPMCDPLIYPLFFPWGEFGYSLDLRYNKSGNSNRAKVTIHDYYVYRLAWRKIKRRLEPDLNAASLSQNRLYMGGLLTQQFIIDAWVKVEDSRLQFLRYNQEKLRVDNYRGLTDWLARQIDNNNNRPPGVNSNSTLGRPVVLPSSHIGSPRNMNQHYQDAMSIVRRFGKPDLFITFTCNPNWPELRENKIGDSIINERPDLLCRVFHMKVLTLIKDIYDNNIFGKCLAYSYTIEFQKRGLPHAHLVFTLNEDSKPNTPDEIDKLVSAELPNRRTESVLFSTVTTCLIHRCNHNCRSVNDININNIDSNYPCLKGYPKSFHSNTIQGNDGYPLYRRLSPDHGGSFYLPDNNSNRDPIAIDNSRVVPHNPYLTLKYNAHINVEICNSVNAIKYLHKYMHKGNDRAMVRIEQSNLNSNNSAHDQINNRIDEYDEIQCYIDARCLTPPECMWRLYSFPLHGSSHNIVRLAIHLPQENNVFFIEGQESRAISNIRDTTLTMWFQLNRDDPSAHEYYYYEIPEHYVQKIEKNSGLMKWYPRQRGSNTVIGRMYIVNPRDQELFCLRLLLLHVKGATSFQELRTYEDIVYDTFFKAANARYLLHNDEELSNCLKEAAESYMPNRLREMFVMIIQFAEPQNTLELWEKFKDNLSEDYYHKLQSLNLQIQDSTIRYHLALSDIETIILKSGILNRIEHDQQARIGNNKRNLRQSTLMNFVNAIDIDGNGNININGEFEEDVMDDRTYIKPKTLLEQYNLPLYDKLKVKNSLLAIETNEIQRLNLARAESEQDQYKKEGDRLCSSFNNDQKRLFDAVIEALDDHNKGRLFFVDGPGGSGKTYFYNALLYYLLGRGISVAAVAYTGIAALLLKGGRTSHSLFGLPLKLTDTSRSSIKIQSIQAKRLMKLQVIIWDEASMIHKNLFQIVSSLIEDIYKGNKSNISISESISARSEFLPINPLSLPMAGKLFILGGDFRQVLPVIPRASSIQIINNTIKGHRLWSNFRQFSLRQNMRLAVDNNNDINDNNQFAAWQLELGSGNLNLIDSTNGNRIRTDLVEIPIDLLINYPINSDGIDELIDNIFGNINEMSKLTPFQISERVILCGLNESVFIINDRIHKRLSGLERCYRSVDSIKMIGDENHNNQGQQFPTEFLNTLQPSGMPPHELKLKPGSIVMLLRNLNMNQGLCNGTRLIVIKCAQHYLECQPVTESINNNNTVLIPRIILDNEDERLPFILQRRQFPIRLAFAMTINKSQGQTFEKVGINLLKPVFGHGQLYVAFSRCRRRKNVAVLLPKLNQWGVYNITKNIVYGQVFEEQRYRSN